MSVRGNVNSVRYFNPVSIKSDVFIRKLHDRRSNYICEKCIEHNELYVEEAFYSKHEVDFFKDRNYCFCCDGFHNSRFRRMAHIRNYSYFRKLPSPLILTQSRFEPRYADKTI
jgi:hypothetical protein